MSPPRQRVRQPADGGPGGSAIASVANARSRAIWHALVSVATVAVFARAVPYPLQRHWDDTRFLIDNPDVRRIGYDTWLSIWSQPHFQAYHPLHLLSYWIDVPWAGPHGPTLHAVSLALFVVAVNLLLWFFRGLGLSWGPAGLGTLVVALHPAQVEAVSWATGRKDVLALLFICLCGGLHLRSQRPWDASAWGSRAAFVAAALSKTTVLPWPLVLLAHDIWLRGRRSRDALVRQLPALSIALVLGAVVLFVWRDATMIRTTAGGVGQFPARVGATFWHQLGTALWPAHVAPMYSARPVEAPRLLSWAVAPALVAVIWALRRRRVLAFGLTAFALLMLPVSNAIPMYFPLQDRYLSLPLVGLGIAFGALLQPANTGAGTGRRWLLGGVPVAALALVTVSYEGAWRSDLRLWEHAATAQPDAYYAWLKLGEVRRDAGQFEGAVRAYRRVVALRPERKLGYAALLRVLALKDERDFGLSPSLAEEHSKAFYEALDDAAQLRALSGRMLRSGHVRALELPLELSLRLSPLDDLTLERAARVQLRDGHVNIARLYVKHMKQPPRDDELKTLRAP